MKILFSPSEAKFSGGNRGIFNKNSFIFPHLYEKRLEMLRQYQDFLDTASNEQLSKLFGTKKQEFIEYYKSNIFEKETLKAVRRYDGVAYDYLQYKFLDDIAQEYIDKNVIIFSNLFGPVAAGDVGLPDYKLQQGEKVGTLALETFYNIHFRDALDKYLQDEDILDLRAGFYEKFYQISKPYITMKFMKDKKVVSHWAKAYRGIVLREAAKNGVKTKNDLLNMQIENLSVAEIKQIKFKTEIVYNILE
jgi:hypothetical protein